MRYALDTNAIIDLLNADPSLQQKVQQVELLGGKLIIPPIVHYEIVRGFLYSAATKKLRLYNELKDYLGLGKLTVRELEVAAEIYNSLRKRGLSVSDADILIAAFCIVGDYTLITNNTKDFENIAGLQRENWLERE